MKIQPHSKTFLDISDPRAVLETYLRQYSCLTVGDTIVFHYNERNYYIDIVEAKPQRAVSIIETDCEVDFLPPKDYVEPERPPPPPSNAPGLASTSTPMAASATVGSGNATGTGTETGAGLGATLGRRVGLKRPAGEEEGAGAGKSPNDDDEEEAKPTFIPFGGTANRISGKKGGGSATGGGSRDPPPDGRVHGEEDAAKIKAEKDAKRAAAFAAFSGTSRRLKD